MNTFQNKKPSEAKVLYIDLKQDEGYETLKLVTNKIITAFVNEGIIRKEELSHITFN